MASSNFKIAIAIFAGVLAVLLFAHESNGLIPWQTDYPAASIQARSAHKLILLDFYATWCGPCREMASETWSDKRVADSVADMIPVHINVDNNFDLCQHFAVRGIPKVVVVDGDGNVIAEHVGGMGASDFIMWLHSVRTGY